MANDGISLSIVLGDIYEASYRPDHWPIALEHIAAYSYSDSAVYINRDNELDSVNSAYFYNIPKSSIDEYNKHGYDPNFSIMMEKVPMGVPAAIDHLVPDRDALEAIYGERFTKMITASDRPHIGGVIVFMDEVRSAAIAVQRKRSSGVWTKEEINRLNDLVPHLRRSITIRKEFARLTIREQALKQGLDRLVMGLILFDKQLRPIYMNHAAKSILNYHPALLVRDNRILGYSHEITDRIYEALRKVVCDRDIENASPPSMAFGIKHPSCDITLPVVISPVCDILRGFKVDELYAHAVMCFNDPDRYISIDAEMLSNTYELTPAEAQVAISLVNGLKPEGIAEMKGVTLSTVRSQIRAIYKKLGVNQQTDLVKILFTGPCAINF